MKRDELFLHEEILLLSLRDAEGTPVRGAMIEFALGGAILAELLLNERIRVVQPRRTPLAEPVTRVPLLGDGVLDACLKRVRNAKRRGSLQTWVHRFARRKFRHEIARGLCRRGILRADEDPILWIFKRKIYPEIDPGPERRIVGRMRDAIFRSGGEVDPRTVTLISLAHHTGILKQTFDKKRLKQRRARIEKIMNGDLCGKATKQAVEAMQAAVLVACIVPAIAVSTATH